MKLPTQAAASSARPSPPVLYPLSAGESGRIRAWQLWMYLLMPFSHAYTIAVQTGADAPAGAALPAWLELTQRVLFQIVTPCIPSAFALIAGALLYRRQFRWRENAARKCRTLLRPLLSITLLWLALYAVAARVPGLRALFSARMNFREWTPRQWFGTFLGWTPEDPCPSPVYPLWFLRDLMLMNLIAPAIRWCVDRFPRLFLTLLAALLIHVPQHFFLHYTVQQVFVFFSLGCYVVKYDLRLAQLDRVPKRLAAALYALLIVIACLLWERLSIRGITNLAGALFLARVCGPGREGRLMRLADCGVAIYLFHERLLTLLKKLAFRLLPAALGTTLFAYYAVPLIDIALCVLFARFMRRHLPRAYALLTGGR